MKTYLDCIPCFVRQALDAVKLTSDDCIIHEQVLREVLKQAAEMDMNSSPPSMAKKIHRIIRQLAEINDPYKQAKRRFNEFALKLFPKFQDLVKSSDKPFETAIRLAMAGNIIDLGVKCSLTLPEAEETIHKALTDHFDMTDFDDFKDATSQAEDILYLADNAGEIVFDRFLIEQIGPAKITLVVKGSPIINDATVEDARDCGLTELVKVIDNGDNAPGTILESCSKEFVRRFEGADLIISKGQGNFETLSDVDRNIYFILRAKCPVIAEHLDCPVGAMILRKNRVMKAGQLAGERS